MTTTGVRAHTRDGHPVRAHARRVPWAERLLSETNGGTAGVPAPLGVAVIGAAAGAVQLLTAVMQLTTAILVVVATILTAAVALELNAGRRRKRGPARQPRARRPPGPLSLRRRVRLHRHRTTTWAHRRRVWLRRKRRKYQRRIVKRATRRWTARQQGRASAKGTT